MNVEKMYIHIWAYGFQGPKTEAYVILMKKVSKTYQKQFREGEHGQIMSVEMQFFMDL